MQYEGCFILVLYRQMKEETMKGLHISKYVRRGEAGLKLSVKRVHSGHRQFFYFENDFLGV